MVDGTGSNGVCLLGEAPGEQEAKRGKPFVGPAGFRLERMVQQLGASRNDFLITNVCWHRPPGNREPIDSEVEQWRPKWEAAIRNNPAPIKVIVPLGNVSLYALLKFDGIQGKRGYLWWSETLSCWVLPTVHPSFIVRGNSNWTAAWLRDVGMALEVAANGPPPAPNRQMTLDPSPYELHKWADGWDEAGRPPLAFDIETPDKGDDEEEAEIGRGAEAGVIYRIGFAYRHVGCTHACSMPWGGAFATSAAQLLQAAPTALVWNRHFDVPRLRAHGAVVGGVLHDVQEMWHVVFSDLPKKLEFVAPWVTPSQPYWKDQAQERPSYYNAVDAAITAEAFEVLWQ